MSFNGTEGSFIELNVGAGMTAEWRKRHPNAKKAAFMGKNILNEILAQDGCMGIRCYFAINENGEETLVLVGADANENDITEKVANRMGLCPPFCDNNSSPL